MPEREKLMPAQEVQHGAAWQPDSIDKSGGCGGGGIVLGGARVSRRLLVGCQEDHRAEQELAVAQRHVSGLRLYGHVNVPCLTERFAQRDVLTRTDAQ
jgi:hypothetical protein